MSVVSVTLGYHNSGFKTLYFFCRYRLYETVYNKKDSRFGPSPIFGSNCGVVQTGTLSVGDIVTL